MTHLFTLERVLFAGVILYAVYPAVLHARDTVCAYYVSRRRYRRRS